jgi:hypothetical protein
MANHSRHLTADADCCSSGVGYLRSINYN